MSKTCIRGDETEFGVNHRDAIDHINVGDRVLVDNALFELEVIIKHLLPRINIFRMKRCSTYNVFCNTVF